MAILVYSKSVTVPAGTAESAPATYDLDFNPIEVSEIEVLVPPGNNGHMGWRVSASGTQQIPENVGQWIVADGHELRWPFESAVNSGAWQVQAYNTGIYDHTLYLRFLGDPPAAKAAGVQQPVAV